MGRLGLGRWCAVRSGVVVDGGVAAPGGRSGPEGGEVVAVELGEVVGGHQ
jgi:hypothetical protein